MAPIGLPSAAAANLDAMTSLVPDRPATDAELACPMPTPLLPPADLTPELQAMVDAGVDARWVRALGHTPDLLVEWTGFYWPLLFNGRIETRTKEVARLRIAQLNGCHY